MLDTVLIKQAIEDFIDTNPVEDYHVHIEKDDRQRPYLGLSGLGERCERKVWYQWRHCIRPTFPSRMKRLFRRGDREEYVFIWLLRGIGCTVHEVDSNGKQFSVKDFENHLSGHLDSVILFPKKFWLKGHKPRPVLGEFKTANDKKFEECRKLGVKRWHPKYYGQMQAYCGFEKLPGAVFFIVNKNDDELHIEWVPFVQKAFDSLVEKAENIINSQAPPPRIPSASPTLWDFKSGEGCKYCDALGVCFKKESSQRLCRTCVFAEPGEEASWVCTKGCTFGEVCEHYTDIAHV